MRVPIALAVAGLVFAGSHVAGCRREPPVAPRGPEKLRLPGTLVLDPAYSPDGKLLAYASDQSGKFEIYVHDPSREGPDRRLTRDGQQNFEPAFSPDGRTVAYHSKGRGGLWTIPFEGGEPHLLSDFGSRPAFSPDGEEVAFQSQPRNDLGATAPPAVPPSTIWKVPARGGVARDMTKEGRPVGGHGVPFWSPDGKRLYFVATDSKLSWAEVWAVAAEGGEPEKLLTEKVIYSPVLSREGRLVFGGLDANGHHSLLETRLDRAGGAPVSPLPGTGVFNGVPRQLALSPDGRRLTWAILTTSGNLLSQPLDPATSLPAGPPVRLTSGATRSTWPVFTPDGSRLAFGVDAPGLSAQVWVMDADGRNARQVTRSAQGTFVEDWFPDGKHLLALSKRAGTTPLMTVSAEDGTETPLPLSGPDIFVPRLSPDGKRIAYNSKKGSPTINVWVSDLTTGASRQLTQDRVFFGFPVFSPDGKLLAAQVKRGEDVQVAVVPVDGGDPVQLTEGPGLSWCFSWTPDGTRVAFAGFRQGYWNVFWVSRVTREVRALTNHAKLNAYVRYPTVSPRGDRVVYEYAETNGELFTTSLR